MTARPEHSTVRAARVVRWLGSRILQAEWARPIRAAHPENAVLATIRSLPRRPVLREVSKPAPRKAAGTPRPVPAGFGPAPFSDQALSEWSKAWKNTLTPKSAVVGAGLTTAFSAVRVLTKLGHALDDRLFPEWRSQEVTEPVFIFANPRSGTTMMHRLISFDEERWATWNTYHSFSQSVSARRLINRLAEIDEASLGGTLRKGVNLINDTFFGGWDGIHKLGIDKAEEDEASFALTAMSNTWSLIAPDLAPMKTCADLDGAPDAFRAEFQDWYEGVQMRHLFGDGPEKRILHKSVFFSHRARTILERHPDARLIYMVRHPYESLPSFLNMWFEKWATHQPGLPRACEAARQHAEFAAEMYDRALPLLDELPAENLKVVRYDALVRDPGKTVEEIYEWLGIEPSDEFRARLAEATAAQRAYTSTHSYALEDFGLDRAWVQDRMANVFERFGFER